MRLQGAYTAGRWCVSMDVKSGKPPVRKGVSALGQRPQSDKSLWRREGGGAAAAERGDSAAHVAHADIMKTTASTLHMVGERWSTSDHEEKRSVCGRQQVEGMG
jgi:hypothetical protein